MAPTSPTWDLPPAQGLYDPSRETAACGVGFIVNIDGKTSHKIIRDAQRLAQRMKHRGACGCDNDSGDGAGVMLALPHSFYSAVLSKEGVTLPDPGSYASGILFLGEANAEASKATFEAMAVDHGLKVLHWRLVPVDPSVLGATARATQPLLWQVFIVGGGEMGAEEFERQTFGLRKRASHRLPKDSHRAYICSLSSRTIVYKGQLSSAQIWTYFQDMMDPSMETYLALVHTRFSTNTFPSWERAHPLRMMAHNGEINTLRGNVNLMTAREGVMSSSSFGDSLSSLYPVVEPSLSDSGAVDCCLEFLVQAGGRSLPEAIMTMVPEAWQNDPLMASDKKDFYRWAACGMEPWDGPALMTFTDGRYVGAILDRNGLRPSRYYVTSDRHLVMASEVGVYDVEPCDVVVKSRLKPGRMLLVDTQMKVLIKDEDLKNTIALARPYGEWLNHQFTLKDVYSAHTAPLPPTALPPPNGHGAGYHGDPRLPANGYTLETINMLLLPMIKTEKEALGSMGNDAPLACLSQFQPLVYEYFKQLFAQVTNPPIDPFRERIVMSLACPIGPQANILEPSAEQCRRLFLENPILSLKDLAVLSATSHMGWRATKIDTTFPSSEGAAGILKAIDRVCQEACEAARSGAQMMILSDREAGPYRAAVGAVMTLGAAHHSLIQARQRMKVALLVETAEAREVHHMCVLLGYGADAICPYLVFETTAALRNDGVHALSDDEVFHNYSAAMDRGISKVMAKMGISTLQSYKGAQIFEAVGIAQEVIEKCFKGTASRVGGVGFNIIAEELLYRHNQAYGDNQVDTLTLRNPGILHWRAGGEKHINDPTSIEHLQNASRNNNTRSYETFVEQTMQSVRECTLRGQLELIKNDGMAIDISEVEPAAAIVTRFATGAMSYGSISAEAHSTLAIAMNRIGGKSNTGEGGEDAERYTNQEVGNNKRSAIKQVASGRFGVTAAYLADASEIQIKMAQGAKPGEGGELPGFKVTLGIAKTRHSIPGVGLISPPPHHDIYSIEDLAELIYDLKCSNPTARISVKLVSEVGVGVVASGVAKGKAEHITVSGHDGGTGASSWTGIKSAGLPWELGVSEAHQTLVLNNLRSRIVLQADGQIRCGFDVVVAALLGADEIGLSTAPLIVMGCTMMRKCHLNTCPVGIATQDPKLREKFQGKPEHVVNYLFLLAEEVRQHMASLGLRKFQELIGRTDLLQPRNTSNVKVNMLDFSNILMGALTMRPGTNIVGGSIAQDFELEGRLDNKVIAMSDCVLSGAQEHTDINLDINNEVRCFGSTLSYTIAKKYGDAGLPNGRRININLRGSAGQSFCAFLSKGVNVTLEGDANDYVGKGLTGGEVTIFPHKDLPKEFESELNVIAGNVCLYGATSGKAFFRGIAAERFAVRNSGAVAVVEGVGDHGCEYMTGGVVVILGITGRNFAAGMSGGIAYVLDEDLEKKCNPSMVEILPLEKAEDLKVVEELLKEFVEKTGSIVASNIIADWPASASNFLKVFPYEYQNALKQIAEDEAEKNKVKEVETVKETKVEPQVADIEDMAGDGKNLDKVRGFMKYKRQTGIYRPAAKRVDDWEEIYNPAEIQKGLKKQAARCMDCGVPFCQSSQGCPLGNIIPKWNDLVFNDEWEEALKQLLQTNNFPEFTGRVCPAPCEGSCVLGINESPVAIKNIEVSIIDHAFEKGWMKPQIPSVRTGKSIVIVGSGPAGLACAHQLNKVGHTVTVIERNDRAGGLLQYGIPTMKLSKEVVQRRIDLLIAEGITFKCNTSVGLDVSPADLRKNHDALVLCMGSTWPRDLPIEGRSLNGIEFAMSFLETWQKKQMGNASVDTERITARGKDVIVIGGGDTGCDCIATSLRQGAKSITTFEILPQPPKTRGKDNPWPTYPRVFKVDYGHEEAALKFGKDPRVFSTLTKCFLGEEGRVTGVSTVQIEWGKDDSGNWKQEEVAGTEKIYPADLVLLAMGFLGPEKTILSQLGLQQDPRSNVKTPRGGYATSADGVFAAGDCRRGQSLVVWAISEGRSAAREVDAFLGDGKTVLATKGGLVNAATLSAQG